MFIENIKVAAGPVANCQTVSGKANRFVQPSVIAILTGQKID